MSAKDRLFYKKLKDIQKAHKPDKWEARHPYNWKKEWGPFIKYDADWDGAYFLDLVIYKLEKMYIALDIYSDEVRDSLDKNLAILKKTIDLGKKLQTHDYYVGSHEFSEEHCFHFVYIYDNEGKTGIEALRSKKLLAKVPQKRIKLDEANAEEITVDDLLGDKLANKWVAENGYTKQQVHYAYGGEWDDPKNHDVWLKMVKQEGKTEQKDMDDFFKLISRNLRKWWW